MKRMLATLESWGIRRLEATVRAKNARALAFYQRWGFQVEGTRKACIRIGSEPEDEFYIAKITRC